MVAKNFTSIDDLINKYQSGKDSYDKISTGIAKEIEPALSLQEKYEIKELVEHEPEEEVKLYVQSRRETIKLPPDLKEMGLQDTSSPKFSTYQTVVLPISDDKVYQGLHAPIYSSLRWLATLAMYLLQKAHLTLKVIHGKVIRAIRT
jgi:hypothetical protein